MFVLAAITIAAHALTGKVVLTSGRPAGMAVVWLDGAEKSEPLPPQVVDQRGRKFIPHISVVTVGTRVDFPNNDFVFHNVFTEYHSERFDLGMYARGKTKSQVFDREGLALLQCSIHPEMSAYVMCVNTPYFAICDRSGRFSLPNVPSGTYTVRAWHERGERFSESMPIRAGQELTIKIHR